MHSSKDQTLFVACEEECHPCPGYLSSRSRLWLLGSNPKWWSFQPMSSKRFIFHHEDEASIVESIPFGNCNPKGCAYPRIAYQIRSDVAGQEECLPCPGSLILLRMWIHSDVKITWQQFHGILWCRRGVFYWFMTAVYIKLNMDYLILIIIEYVLNKIW